MTSSAPRHALFGVCGVILAAGCWYEAPTEPLAEPLVAFEIEAVGGVADGKSLIDFVVVVDRKTRSDLNITVETSSGTLATNPDTIGAESRRLVFKNDGSGRLKGVLRVGIVSGDTLLTASLAGYLTTALVRLQPSLAQSIVLTANKRSVLADGESGVDISAQLFAADPAKLVSLGARLRVTTCCPDANQALVACDGPAPLTVPAEVQLSTGQVVAWRGITNRIVAGPQVPAAIPLVIVAEVIDPAGMPVACGPVGAGVRQTLPISLRPASL